jgi:hypothetical protein
LPAHPECENRSVENEMPSNSGIGGHRVRDKFVTKQIEPAFS